MIEDHASGQTAAGFVLAGGRSSRMGSDKALQGFLGKPLITRMIETLAAAGLQVSIAGATSDLAKFGRVIPDSAGVSLGPLSGVCAGLAASDSDFSVFLTVDMPLVPPELIRALLEHARIKNSLVTVASVGSFTETFPVVLRRSILPVLSRELAGGRRGCFAAFQAASNEAGQAISILPVEFLVQAGQIANSSGIPPHLWFLNVNTPEDLVQAEAACSRAHRVS